MSPSTNHQATVSAVKEAIDMAFRIRRLKTCTRVAFVAYWIFTLTVGGIFGVMMEQGSLLVIPVLVLGFIGMLAISILRDEIRDKRIALEARYADLT